MIIIDGKLVSKELRAKMKNEIEDLRQNNKKVPGLAVVIVGENPASKIYVANKIKSCNEIGIKSYSYELSNDITNKELIGLMEELNSNNDINGILVQLPLPKHLNEEEILSKIDVKKDVDGFSAYQMGKLVLGQSELAPCTPSGIMEFFKYYNIDLTGKNAVVIGRSNIVGKPMSIMLTKANATVTICHSRTKNLAEITNNADILVAAIGKAKFVSADMVKNGAVVIDVGMNRDNGKLCGDVDFENAKEKCSFITPVPGGVGPMTITMLLHNTLKAYKLYGE